MASVNIVESRKSIQYSGANSTEIDSEITDLTIDSEIAGVLTVTSNGSQYVVNTGDWINFWQGYIQGVFSNATFGLYYIAHPVGDVDISELETAIDDLEDAVSGLSSSAVRSTGVATAPTLLLNTPADVAVQLVPAMPDTSYTATAHVFGSGISLSNVTINSVTITDTDTVTVSVQTGLVSLAGVNILVVAKD
jgi:hypothetical protein